jgi:sialic acid synthase SpsE
MSLISLRNGRTVGDFEKPYYVAEFNTSHFGDLSLAEKMIDQAKLVGCDCVKFQSWSADTLYASSYYAENPIAKRIVSKFSLDNEQLKALSNYCRSVEMDFASTPYSIEEARFLADECDVPFIKVASMELNNLPYLQEIGSWNIPIVLSTGMGTLDEILQAVNIIKRAGNEGLVVLHCTSIYPAEPGAIRLKNIIGLREALGNVPVGYSDHSQGIEIPTASVAYGACLIEKHFTLDKSRIGMDNQMATEPDEMRRMIYACNRVYESLGGPDRELGQEERDQALKMRRSMIARNDLESGQVLAEDMVEFKRPGTGIAPSNGPSLFGRKVIRSLRAGELFSNSDFE